MRIGDIWEVHTFNNRLTILISLSAHEKALDRIRKICLDGEIRIGPWIDSEGQRMSPELTKGADVLLCEVPPANFDDFDRLNGSNSPRQATTRS